MSSEVGDNVWGSADSDYDGKLCEDDGEGGLEEFAKALEDQIEEALLDNESESPYITRHRSDTNDSDDGLAYECDNVAGIVPDFDSLSYAYSPTRQTSAGKARGDNTPVDANKRLSLGKTPDSPITTNRLFTPMSIGQIMKMETPTSGVDNFLEALRGGRESIFSDDNTSDHLHISSMGNLSRGKKHVGNWRQAWDIHNSPLRDNGPSSSILRDSSEEEEDDDDLAPSPRHAESLRQTSTVHVDERLHGDISYFHQGDRLSNEGIRCAYAGMCDTALSLGSHYSVQVVECVVRPDIDIKKLMAVVLTASKQLNLQYKQYQSSHAVISASSNYVNATSWTDNSEWDIIDLQVCISKELRQRVLIMQFLKNLSPFANIQPATPIEGYPQIKNFVDALHYIILQEKLSLSCLYAIDPSMCIGLDHHFKSQLYALCREVMWDGLKEAFLALEEHMRAMEVQCARFMATIEPVYKDHGLKMPSPRPRRKISEYSLRLDLDTLDKLHGVEENLLSKERDDDDDNDDIHTTELTDASRSLKINGMTHCLDMIHNALKTLQKKCDLEFSARLQQKNEYTVAVISDLFEYRRELLKCVAYSPDCESSSLNVTFKNTFKGISLTLPPRPAEIDSCEMDMEAAPPLVKMDDYLHDEIENDLSDTTLHNVIHEDSGNAETPSSNVYSQGIAADLGSWLFGRSPQPEAPTPPVKSKPAFISPSRRANQTAAQAKARLTAYSKAIESSDANYIVVEEAEVDHKSSSTSSPVGLVAKKEIPIKKDASANDCDRNFPTFPLKPSPPPPHDNVLYYCACLVGGIPGKLYLTPYVLCFVYGVLGISNVKEVLPLHKLEAVIAPSKEASLLAANTLKLSFFAGSRELFISPIVVECLRLRSILMDAKECFAEFSSINRRNAV